MVAHSLSIFAGARKNVQKLAVVAVVIVEVVVVVLVVVVVVVVRDDWVIGC